MSSAMWKSELASVCRRHRDLVAIYEAPEGTLALLLRQTLVPLSEERGRWFNDTRRTARAVVASLRAAGVTEDVTVLQWRPLPDVAQVLTGWPCCYLSDPRRCAQLADIVGARLADGEPAAPAPLGRGENGLRSAALAIPPTNVDWYRDMAPGFLAGAPPADPPDAPLDRRARPDADRTGRAPGGGGPPADGPAHLAARPGHPASRAQSLANVDPADDRRPPARAGVAGGPAHGGVGPV